MKIPPLLFIVIGYLVGVIGSVLFSSMDTIHHWVIGALVLAVGIIFDLIDYRKYPWALPLALFGFGLMCSDFADMVNMRVWGIDPPGSVHWI